MQSRTYSAAHLLRKVVIILRYRLLYSHGKPRQCAVGGAGLPARAQHAARPCGAPWLRASCGITHPAAFIRDLNMSATPQTNPWLSSRSA
jgi:hypothetical protein